MSGRLISTSGVDDNRAVAPVIGVVILFGFLILALSLYQVEIVPQQNAETEFQHSGEVRNDLVELRAGILQAGSIDQPQYQTVQLGTAYSTRVFAINPPAPAGTIRTVEAPPITISNNSGTPEGNITIPTRFVEYRPGYNELDRSPTWYDASVLYLDARDEGGKIAVIEDQALVNGREVQITALQREFRRSGTGQVTLELRPAKDVTDDVPEGNLTVTVPTRLSSGEYWDAADIPTGVYGGVSAPNDDGVHNLTLETTASNLTVDTVGVQEAPEEPTQNNNAQIGSDGGDGATDGGDGSDTGVQCVAGGYDVNSNENGDIAYTGSVNVNAKLSGDVVAGGSVIINSNGRVEGNIQAGGSVTVNSGARVTGNIISGGNIIDNNSGRGNGIQGDTNDSNPGYAPCNN
ncbi:polymer-forming cytoskeletal protein [Halorubrum tropicale]|uniref:polymer-forming cytoskeletal protein n=1 Tax=Halorubrum tropicale TaxID=1765655 RepID=UPI000A820CAF|nr:polymer-forming cytoskeletal protein [Halorubrum tropicale]